LHGSLHSWPALTNSDSTARIEQQRARATEERHGQPHSGSSEKTASGVATPWRPGGPDGNCRPCWRSPGSPSSEPMNFRRFGRGGRSSGGPSGSTRTAVPRPCSSSPPALYQRGRSTRRSARQVLPRTDHRAAGAPVEWVQGLGFGRGRGSVTSGETCFCPVAMLPAGVLTSGPLGLRRISSISSGRFTGGATGSGGGAGGLGSGVRFAWRTPSQAIVR
jgi:hypothetical protein